MEKMFKKSIVRYDLHITQKSEGGTDSEMIAHPFGTYVDIDDHAKLINERNVEIQKLHKLLKKCKKRLIDIDGFSDDNIDLIKTIEAYIEK